MPPAEQAVVAQSIRILVKVMEGGELEGKFSVGSKQYELTLKEKSWKRPILKQTKN